MLLNKKAFTLLELMIVVIIIAILASLAMPRFIAATNKAKESEAKNMLGAIRSSQMRYYLEATAPIYATDIANLDISVGSSDYFTYTAVNTPGTGEDQTVGEADGSGSSLSKFRIQVDGDIVTF